MHSPLIDTLRHPGCYPHPVGSVELIETHISWVLLAGEFVYKLKKPLNLGFLDFSTLARRKFYCEEEVRLNRRTAPDLYVEVVGIGGTPDHPMLEGSGEAFEYAVKMCRFDPAAGFDRMLAQGRLESRHIVDLGQALAELHRIADVAGTESPLGNVAAVVDPIRDNFTDLDRALHHEAIARGLSSLERWTEAQLVRLLPLIRQRHRDGFIRECHGDLHLGNIALICGRATLFDCVEFSEDLRWIDVVSDLAFAVMDLHSRGEPGLAWRLLDTYVAVTGDYSGLRLLPLYMVYRALVRAKVAAIRLNDSDADRESVLEQIAGYLGLATRISQESRPAVLITLGVSASGKSWLGQQLVERVGLVRLRSDIERKRLHGLGPQDRSGSGVDSGLYSAEATARTYHCLADATRSLVDAGIPALIDAACLQRWQRRLFSDLAAELGVPFGMVHCHADDAVLRQRIVAREAVGDDPSEAGVAVLEQQQRTREPLDPVERAQALSVDTTADCLAHVAHWIRQRIGQTAAGAS